jgi:hypothetical protein
MPWSYLERETAKMTVLVVCEGGRHVGVHGEGGADRR